MLFNLLLIKQILDSKKSTTQNLHRDSRKNRMCQNIIIISFLFMISSLPTASIQGSTFKYLVTFELGQLIITVCNSIAFTYQASNFIMHFCINKKFSDAVKVFFGIKEQKRLDLVSHTNGASYVTAVSSRRN